MKQLVTILLILLLSSFSYTSSNIEDVNYRISCTLQNTSSMPFCNTSLPLDTRINDLISRLSLEDKSILITDYTTDPTNNPLNIPEYGIPYYNFWQECLHGAFASCDENHTCPTSFSNPNGLGAAFNKSLYHLIGQTISDELRAMYKINYYQSSLNCWAPNININRDPRWGRNNEVPSEDPYANGQYAINLIKGMQEGVDPRYVKVIGTMKHFDAYSLENYEGMDRFHFNAIVGNYDLANTYFPAFKATVQEGNVLGLMCSYNMINGVPSCANDFLLQDVLRDTWNFEGYITSDCGAVENIYNTQNFAKNIEQAVGLALQAGTDGDCGDGYQKHLQDSYSEGYVNMTTIDQRVYTMLKMRFIVGLFDPIEDQPYWNISSDVIGSEQHQQLNLEAAQQTLVLLKNDNNTLPYSKGSTIAVIGPNADGITSKVAMEGTYYQQVCPGDGLNSYGCMQSPLDAIKEANINGQTLYASGCFDLNCYNQTGFEDALNVAQQADQIVIFLGLAAGSRANELGYNFESEGLDRVNITLPLNQTILAQQILALNKPTTIVLFNGGMLAIDSFYKQSPAIIEAFYPGFQGAKAIASVIFGDYSPSGKLPVTLYSQDIINELDFFSMNMTLSPGRTYRYYQGTPIYPFGHGLSYAQFKLEQVSQSFAQPVQIQNSKKDQTFVEFIKQRLLSQNYIQAYDQDVTYTLKVKNIHESQAGSEVIFAFWRPAQNSSILQKQLFSYQKVHLEPLQETQISFNVNFQTFAQGDTFGNLVSSPGQFELIFTNGVEEILTANVEIIGDVITLEQFPQRKQ